jgi:hypothetical protein
MEKESFTLKGLILEQRHVVDVLRMFIHSILFQRELGVVIPRTVESESGICYLTLDHIDTDKKVEEFIALAYKKLTENSRGTVVLSFFEFVKKKSFLLFQENSKRVWEEWKFPVRVVPNESKKMDLKVVKGIRKMLMAVVERICFKKEHLPNMGEPDHPDIIRFPFEIFVTHDLGDSVFSRHANLIV